MSKETSFNVSGTVKFAGIEGGQDTKSKSVVSLKLTDERADVLRKVLKLEEDKHDGTPIKETEDGQQFFKASTVYPIEIYDNGAIVEDIPIQDIGEDSQVIITVSIASTTYKRKSYQVAYLKAINILKLEEAVHFNPFAKGAEITTV